MFQAAALVEMIVLFKHVPISKIIGFIGKSPKVEILPFQSRNPSHWQHEQLQRLKRFDVFGSFNAPYYCFDAEDRSLKSSSRGVPDSCGYSHYVDRDVVRLRMDGPVPHPGQQCVQRPVRDLRQLLVVRRPERRRVAGASARIGPQRGQVRRRGRPAAAAAPPTHHTGRTTSSSSGSTTTATRPTRCTTWTTWSSGRPRS